MATSSEMAPAESVSPVGLAAYQQGAVVSRTLLKRAGGTITLFAFDEGQALSEHTAPFDALVLTLEGSLTLTIGGRNVQTTPQTIVLMPANVPHAVHAIAAARMLLIMLRAPTSA